ncbi:MAG: hypothetical protein QNJ20_15295 [Paracoccaceae bacterium]|nr:hypothetical protein [Paracoccaceae bacterium]
MADRFIALIPRDHEARISSDTLAELETIHAGLCGVCESRAKDFGERLQFIDCGENHQSIHCPACDTVAEQTWWHQRMDHAWDRDHGFHICDFTMPCCGATTRLDKLDYRPAQGFAHWFVSARDPGREALTADEIARLEAVADLPLRIIYQAYP